MKRLRKKAIFLILLIVTQAENALAIVLDLNPTSILKTWHEINHWAGITAATITIAMITAAYKMPPIQNPIKAKTIDWIMKVGGAMAFLFFFAEYADLFEAIIINAIDLMVDLWNGIL